MGSEILKGCSGACRIIIVVFLLATSIIFGVSFKNLTVEDHNHTQWYTICTISLSFVIMVVLCIWYSLLFYDVVEYSEYKRKIDGIGHYSFGIIIIVMVVGLLLSWKGVEIPVGGYPSDEKKKIAEKLHARKFYFFLSGNISFAVSAVVGIVLGCKLRCCCGGCSGQGGGAEQAPAQASDVNDNSIPTPDPASQSKL